MNARNGSIDFSLVLLAYLEYKAKNSTVVKVGISRLGLPCGVRLARIHNSPNQQLWPTSGTVSSEAAKFMYPMGHFP